jgi:hypothetical protein
MLEAVVFFTAVLLYGLGFLLTVLQDWRCRHQQALSQAPRWRTAVWRWSPTRPGSSHRHAA